MDTLIRMPKEKEYEEIVAVINSQIEREKKFFTEDEYEENFPKITIEDLKRERGKRYHLVVEENGKIVAHASYYIKMNNILWLSQIVVLPKYQNKGIARKLLIHIEKEARSKKIKALALETQKVFDWAVNFYKKQNYIVLSSEDFKKEPFAGTLDNNPVESTYIFGKIL